ncbi:MAG: hypothetical protein IPL64_04315 [Flavobacteriales bacterium]|jgi:hypothetical protein|nr:hypothetical protein [Flavobacteriales bacterium]
MEDEETIARYAFFSDEVRADGTPRPKLFEPDKHHECSVFRTDGLTATEIQRIGDEVVSPNYGKLPYGHCDLFVGQVRHQVHMQVESVEPPTHHACIRGYAADKSAWKLQAAQLSQQAALFVRFRG